MKKKGSKRACLKQETVTNLRPHNTPPPADPPDLWNDGNATGPVGAPLAGALAIKKGPSE
ncbi:MAG: hypothetical protein RBR67_04720 [Desulfobacterium sp.]|nr:hypothetical protein [Desulfobacterium sp.]